MRKAFTLIELIIVIAIITLMAVLAVPAFDNYGARNDLDMKAEEIKLYIETAYKQAQSPIKDTNGTAIIITQSSPPSIDVVSAKFSGSAVPCNYYFDDLRKNCTVANIIPMNNLFFDGSYSMNNLNTDGAGFSPDGMLFLSPSGDKNIYFYSSLLGSNSATSLSFDIVYSRISTGDNTRTITINRYPFSVSVN